jgi:hypothetical protein
MASQPVEELFTRPPRGIIPLSKGGDLVIDFMQKIDNDYVDYQPGVAVTLIVDTVTIDLTATATINGYHAVCRLESTEMDLITNTAIWRCVVSYPTIPTTEIVAMNGTIVRADY